MSDGYDIPFTPPERQFQDTLLAFRDYQDASTIGARIDPDPLGPVNRIVRLTVGGKTVRSVLYPVRAGTAVKLGRDAGHYWSDGPGWRTLGFGVTEEPRAYRPPSLYVEVDGKRVIDVPEHETRPTLPPPPPVPWQVRTRRAVNSRVRAYVNRIAKRYGYIHEDDVEEEL